MDKVIFRHELEVEGYQELKLPVGFKVLSCAPSRVYPNTMIDVWIQQPINSDLSAGTTQVAFHIFGTGHKIPSYLLLNHVGTTVHENGLVWHVHIGTILPKELQKCTL